MDKLTAAINTETSAPAPAPAPAPPAAPTVLSGLEDELMMKATVDRS